MKPLLITSIFLFATLSLFSQKVYKEEIPDAFKTCKGCVLLIFRKEPNPKAPRKLQKIDEKMIEFTETFIKKYKGKTAFITPAEFESNPIYKDSTFYRFILNTGLYTYQSQTQVEKPRIIEVRTADLMGLNLNLTDRVIRRTYNQLSTFAGWEKNFEKVAEAFNKELEKAGSL